MFKSISQAAPGSTSKTGFFAQQTITLETQSPITFYINGVQQSGLSISASLGDYVEAEVVAPNDYLSHQFYYYKLNGLQLSFALATKTIYNINFIPENISKRWYDYNVEPHTASILINSSQQVYYGLRAAQDSIDFTKNILLDPRTNQVYFLSDIQVTYVLELSGTPREYVLDTDNNLLYIASSVGLLQVDNIGNVLTIQDTPSCYSVDIKNDIIALGSTDEIWLLDAANNFSLQSTLLTNTVNERIVDVKIAKNDDVICITDNQKVINIDTDEVSTVIRTDSVFGYVVHNNGESYFPDCLSGDIVGYEHGTGTIGALVHLDKFSPNFLTIKNGFLYVCGNDSNEIRKVDLSDLTETILYADEKITRLSVTDSGYIFMSHYLKDVYVFDTRDIKTLLPFKFYKRYGPVTHIGSNLVEARIIGDTTIRAYTPFGATLWLNGNKTNSSYDIRGVTVTDKDMFSVSYAAKTAGTYLVPVVLGDSAVDFEVEVNAETYFPRYINFPIKRPDSSGYCIYEFTMPNKMQPTKMACEYGYITLNGLPYTGQTYVYPNDEIKIVMQFSADPSFAYGVAPIFTLGSRQFAIPVVASYNLQTPTTYEDTYLERSTPLQQTITITPEESQHDYIFPQYYDIVFKRNGYNIVGNYYQQFSKNDVLTVEYSSSPKYYDDNDVYILGETSYYFVARNTPAEYVGYMDFGNISQPYVRNIESNIAYAGSQTISNGTITFTSNNVVAPVKQYFTANATITGLSSGNPANLTIYGGDSYFIHNGLLTNDRTISVIDGDQLALARTFQNYYEGNVFVIQDIYDIEGDIQEVPSGEWGVNQLTIESEEFFTPFTQTKDAGPEIKFDKNVDYKVDATVIDFEGMTNFIKSYTTPTKTAPESRLKSYFKAKLNRDTYTEKRNTAIYNGTNLIVPFAKTISEYNDLNLMALMSSVPEYNQSLESKLDKYKQIFAKFLTEPRVKPLNKGKLFKQKYIHNNQAESLVVKSSYLLYYGGKSWTDYTTSEYTVPSNKKEFLSNSLFTDRVYPELIIDNNKLVFGFDQDLNKLQIFLSKGFDSKYDPDSSFISKDVVSVEKFRTEFREKSFFKGKKTFKNIFSSRAINANRYVIEPLILVGKPEEAFLRIEGANAVRIPFVYLNKNIKFGNRLFFDYTKTNLTKTNTAEENRDKINYYSTLMFDAGRNIESLPFVDLLQSEEKERLLYPTLMSDFFQEKFESNFKFTVTKGYADRSKTFYLSTEASTGDRLEHNYSVERVLNPGRIINDYIVYDFIDQQAYKNNFIVNKHFSPGEEYNNFIVNPYIDKQRYKTAERTVANYEFNKSLINEQLNRIAFVSKPVSLILTIPIEYFYVPNLGQLVVPLNYKLLTNNDTPSIPLGFEYVENSTQQTIPLGFEYIENSTQQTLPLLFSFEENSTQRTIPLLFSFEENSTQRTIPLRFSFEENNGQLTVPLGFEHIPMNIAAAPRLPPEFVEGTLWDNPANIEPNERRGLFVDVASALTEASQLGYNAVPYLVYLTGLYSYRVDVDLSLQCLIIRRPYPIKWLIRGG